MDRQQYLIERFGIDTSTPPPYSIPMSRYKKLPYLFNDLGIRMAAEVGVERGRYSEALLKRMPELTLYSIDCWEIYDDYRAGMAAKTREYYEDAVRRLGKYGQRSVLIKKYSADALADFADGSLDLVYIDGNHTYDYVLADIAGWSKKVWHGGLVAGHDYLEPRQSREHVQVKRALHDWVAAQGIDVWFVTEEGGRSPSWFYVNP